MRSPETILETAFLAASENTNTKALPPEKAAWIGLVAAGAETQKAVLAALMTSLVKKIETPQQDIRFHKVEMQGGYSGRSFDTNYVTPFIRRHFPRLAMRSGSGWLTRSVEQNHPFTLDFTGKIQNTKVKSAFLNLLHSIETENTDAENLLVFLLGQLILLTDSSQVVFTPTEDRSHITIEAIIQLLRTHFFHDYKTAGASRLPVLAIYALYGQLMESPRYQGKILSPLKSHTTSDTKSRSYADVEILNADETLFEGVEIKHGIAISPTLVSDAYEKFCPTPVTRFYLLTTAEPNMTDFAEIQKLVSTIRQTHGCEVIVNGILPSLKYSLRLLPEPGAFLDGYSALLQADYEANTDVKQTHLIYWKELLARLQIDEERPEG